MDGLGLGAKEPRPSKNKYSMPYMVIMRTMADGRAKWFCNSICLDTGRAKWYFNYICPQQCDSHSINDEKDGRA
jgi:hypothetical protein